MRYAIVLSLLIGAHAGAVFAFDQAAFLKRCEEERPKEIARMEKSIRTLAIDRAAMAKGVIDKGVEESTAGGLPGQPSRWAFHSKEVKATTIKKADQEIADAKKWLAGLKDKTILAAPIIKGGQPVDDYSISIGIPPERLMVGDAGRWLYPEVHIDQVISNTEVICRNGFPFLLRGVDTSKMVDDGVTPMADLYEVTGTYKYETVDGGSKQIIVLEPLKLDYPAAKK